MNPIIKFETNNLATVKKKMEAYHCLFDTTPVLWIGGYFEDAQEEMVHFRSSSQAIAIGRKWISADVDGKIEKIKPTDARFSICSFGE